MSLPKSFLCSLALAFSLILNACGGGSSPTSQAENTDTTGRPTTSDFFQLAVVPDQTVSTPTFEVQVIAENVDPNRAPTPPVVVDGAGVSSAMSLVTLKWPGTTENSIQVYSKAVPLIQDQINNIKVTSGSKEISFSVRHKSAKSVLTASNGTELASFIKTAISDPTVDVVEINYDEPDLGGIIHNIGNGVANNRTTWLTVRPAPTRLVSWARNTATPTRRPMVDFLNLSGIIFGADSSDGGGGQLYIEALHRIWLSGVEFRAKYKFSWPKTTKMTANYLADLRILESEGQKAYFTDCLWDGTASTVATTSVQLARDLRFNSHRGDYNNFGKVFLNVLAQDASPIVNAAGTDSLHNDGFQIWGNVGTNGIVFKGFKVVSPNVGAELQPFLFDRTFTPNYSNILLDSIAITGAPATTLKAQLAGAMRDSRISNLSFTDQSMTIRQDFVEPNGAFSPGNVRIHNLNARAVEYFGVGTSRTYSFGTVSNPADISTDLNAVSALAGATFSNIRLSP